MQQHYGRPVPTMAYAQRHVSDINPLEREAFKQDTIVATPYAALQPGW